MTLNIAYIFDANYLVQAGVSIFSLLANNKRNEIHIFLIHPKDLPKDIERIHRTIEEFGSSYSTLYIDDLDPILEELKVPTYNGSRAVYYRLFLGDLIQQVDRLLYLDGDTIIEGDIMPLYNTDLEDNIIGMCYDSNSVEVKHAYGCKDGEPYYNNGIVLYDLKKYRETIDRERTIDAISNICARSILPDQDFLNFYFKGRIKDLDLRYNFQPIHAMFKSDIYLHYFKKDYYSKEQIDEASNNVVIMHAIRMFGDRPWDHSSLHPFTDEFEKYRKESLWSNYSFIKKEKKTVHKIEYHLYKLLPKRLFFYVFYKIHKRDVMKELETRREIGADS